jgi:hypothetical protein
MKNKLEILKNPPKKDPIFIRIWEILIDEVMANEKFKTGDLLRLEVLCDLYVEKDRLEQIIEMIGFTYDGGETKVGNIWKLRPEVTQLNKVKQDILNYSKSLGLVLTQSKSSMASSDEVDEWS